MFLERLAHVVTGRECCIKEEAVVIQGFGLIPFAQRFYASYLSPYASTQWTVREQLFQPSHRNLLINWLKDLLENPPSRWSKPPTSKMCGERYSSRWWLVHRIRLEVSGYQKQGKNLLFECAAIREIFSKRRSF